MSAVAALKGILISIAVIAAVGFAVLESPQVQSWLEEQRRKIVELLRSIGEELDPASRRAAEAFAFEGRTPATDEGLRREASGSQNATAMATGRSLPNSGLNNTNRSRVYDIPVRGPTDPDEAEERRRKGREYLAKRNQEMIELRQRRKSKQETDNPKSPTATSFDEMIDAEGRLLSPSQDSELPSAPRADHIVVNSHDAVDTLEKSALEPLLVEVSSSSSSAWQAGSQMANPFGDEYALDRSETPKPSRPPKVEVDTPNDRSGAVPPTLQRLPGDFNAQLLNRRLPEQTVNQSNLSYKEQLAIALSLSEAEYMSQLSRDDSAEDAALQTAINASLREMKEHRVPQPNRTIGEEPQQLIEIEPEGPLPDVTANTQTATRNATQPHGHSLSSILRDSESTSDCGTDELYHISPQPTASRLVNFDALQNSSSPDASTYLSTIDDVTLQNNPKTLLDRRPDVAPAVVVALAPSSQPNVATSTTDLGSGEHLSRERTPTPTSHLTSSQTWDESDGESDVFASVHERASRSASRAQSEISNVEVIDVGEDSDGDLLSEGGYSIATPDSWTEVGSQDGESDMDDIAPHLTQQAQPRSG